MKKKTIITAVTALLCAAMLASCGEVDAESGSDKTAGTAESSVSDSSSQAEETEVPTDDPAEGSSEETSEAESSEEESSEAEESREETAVTESSEESSAPAESLAADELFELTYGQDSTLSEGEYDSISITDNEYGTDILFTAKAELTDFRLLTLQMTDVADDGTPTYASKDEHYQAKLTPEKPLMARVLFAGDLPGVGFAFYDPNGIERRFSICQSGFDGSLVIEEITR